MRKANWAAIANTPPATAARSRPKRQIPRGIHVAREAVAATAQTVLGSRTSKCRWLTTKAAGSTAGPSRQDIKKILSSHRLAPAFRALSAARVHATAARMATGGSNGQT